MNNNLKSLLELAQKTDFSAVDQEEQRRSFAFGNANIENPRVTRAMVDREAEKLKLRG